MTASAGIPTARAAGGSLARRPEPLTRLLRRLAPGSLVLDFGCGPHSAVGSDLRSITAGGHVGTGLAFDAHADQQCRALGLATWTGNLRGLQFAPGSFDAVWSRAGAQLTATDGVLALGELRRVLRGGGLLVVTAGAPGLPVDTPDRLAAAGFAVDRMPRSGDGSEIGAYAV